MTETHRHRLEWTDEPTRAYCIDCGMVVKLRGPKGVAEKLAELQVHAWREHFEEGRRTNLGRVEKSKA